MNRPPIALAALALLAAGPAGAQTGRVETALGGSGLPIGAFRVYPRAISDNSYDDNVFASERDAEHDYVSSTSVGLGAESVWGRHYLSARAAGRFNRYARTASEDSDEYAAEVLGRLDFSAGSELAATFRQGRQTVGRADSENSGRRDPQQLDYSEGRLEYEHPCGRLGLGLRGSVDRLDFVDSLDDDRDRLQFGAATRLGLRFSPALSLFAEPAAEIRDYDQKVDDGGVERSSLLVEGMLGAVLDVGSIQAEIAAGAAQVRFDESDFDRRTTVVARGAATWDPTRLTRIRAVLERRILPTDVDGASSKVSSQGSLRVRHALLRSLFLRGEATYLREEFHELRRTDDNVRLRAGAEIVINRFLSLATEYTYRQRYSDFETREFEKNTITVTLKGQL